MSGLRFSHLIMPKFIKGVVVSTELAGQKEPINQLEVISQVEPINQSLIPKSVLEYAESKWLRMCIDAYLKGTKKHIDSLDNLYKGIAELSVEDAKSLLLFELRLSGNFDNILQYDDDDLKNLLAFQIKSYTDPIHRFHLLIDTKIKNVLPNAYIAWFKNDLRSSLYLAGLMQRTLEENRIVKKGSEEFLTYINDYIRFNAYDYISEIQYNIPLMEHSFAENPMSYQSGNGAIDVMLGLKDLYLNNITPTKEIKWIDLTNDEQIQYLYERLIKQGSLILNKNFFPNNTEEMYYLILASFDSLSNSTGSSGIREGKHKDSSARQLVLSLVEKSWKAVDKRADKSESGKHNNIKVYKKNESKLESLVSKGSTTTSKLINELIIEEYNKTVK